jgi:hypothetical protein
MSPKTKAGFLHYSAAVVFTALAVGLRWLLDPWMGEHLPLVLLYGAVALAVWPTASSRGAAGRRSGASQFLPLWPVWGLSVRPQIRPVRVPCFRWGGRRHRAGEVARLPPHV